MSLPSPALSVPSLLADQVSFNGVTMGNPPNTPFGITMFEGLGKPKVRSGNTSRPQTRGSYVGLNLLDTRTITLTMDIGPPFGAYSNLAGALAALRPAVSTEGVTEVPLWIQIPTLPLVACMARVTGFEPKWDIGADLGSLIRDVPLQFEATDSYFYGAPTNTASVSLGQSHTGFSFPLSFPLGFGGATNPNDMTVTNAGNVPCWPTLIFTGPCTNPVAQNLSLPGNPSVTLNAALNAGDQVVVDCDLGSILYYPAGSSVGQAQNGWLAAGSTFFAIAPSPTVLNGQNLIGCFSSDSGPVNGGLTVWSASAYDGLLG